MENAQLISLSRQMALQRHMDMVANNIANVNTTGFKAEQLLFEEYKMPVAAHGDFSGDDRTLSYVQDWATIQDFSDGAMVQTDAPLDLAISGEGFFTVQTAAGERYTRGGAFQINNEGTLVDLSGNPVMGDGGQIQFGPEETDIRIGADGSISSSAGAKGRLRIVEFEEVQALTREGNNLMFGGTPIPATNSRVLQGFTEKSNVSGVAEMAEMIRVTRAYESIASLGQKQDDMRRDAIKRLGSVSA
ncbi:flagellar basal-body rod protein FlgF [Devosia sp.]|uniref:flagellar basal-body rod protein FlgF n=1 Tax=Devosia sp. TaxID=1871048 RepID=UPI001B0EA19F|nr:flagellar basal-body rod protein FlgF [Devosia sp.]MBO9587655.1 flagellar basal-body rod protein FlgF [Devosia sp.]